MSWLTEFQDATAVRDRTLRNLSLPLGLANPLWLAFGAAASAGAAWWLMTHWARPVNLEAAMAAEAPPPAPQIPTIETKAVVEDVADAIASVAVDRIDDLTRLVGVGPRSAAALAERGVTRFSQLAAWSAEDLAAFDAELKLKGRSLRDAWLDQARRLAADA